MEASSRETPDGVWVCCVAYPELPGCALEDTSIETAIDGLERLRVATIIGLLKAGTPPIAPRSPLASLDPFGLLEHLGLLAELRSLLDKDETDLREC
ncbi:MAG: hypothetical protein WCN98_20160 [Verrucomicrobiaceae bacterium]